MPKYPTEWFELLIVAQKLNGIIVNRQHKYPVNQPRNATLFYRLSRVPS